MYVHCMLVQISSRTKFKHAPLLPIRRRLTFTPSPTTSVSRFLENLDLILVATGFIMAGMDVFIMALGSRLVLLVRSASLSWSWPCLVGAHLPMCSLYPSHQRSWTPSSCVAHRWSGPQLDLLPLVIPVAGVLEGRLSFLVGYSIHRANNLLILGPSGLAFISTQECWLCPLSTHIPQT